MSVQAISWAIERAPLSKPSHLSTLVSLANHADADGEGAYPSHATIGWEARKSTPQVRKDLREMESDGIIQRGDQRMVAHLPADRRPIVWTLDLTRTRDMSARPTKRPASGYSVGARASKSKGSADGS